MKIQKTGPDSLLLVLKAAELQDDHALRRKAYEALRIEGIPIGAHPELTAYTAGDQTVVFVCAGARGDTYFGFDSADDLLDAAYEAGRLFPETEARLCRVTNRFYLATSSVPASVLLREYTSEIVEAEDFSELAEVLIADHAFEILSGRC